MVLTLRYPDTVGGELYTAPLNLQFGVQVKCLIDKPLANMSIQYTSNQAADVTLQQPVIVWCNTGTTWTAGFLTPGSPGSAPVAKLDNQTLLGLNYSLKVTPSSGAGQGNDGQQSVNIGLTVPGVQPGNCASGSCTASTTHTLVLTY